MMIYLAEFLGSFFLVGTVVGSMVGGQLNPGSGFKIRLMVKQIC